MLDALDRTGLAADTIVVFTSDHGYHLGDHHLWMKGTLFTDSTRVPLILRVPGNPRRNTTATGVCELIDLYPTLVDLCGLPAPDHLAGRSLRPLLEDPTATIKSSALTEFVDRDTGMRGASITTGRYRLTLWDDGAGGAELYDLQNDPGEHRNLASATAWQSVQKDLASELWRRLQRPRSAAEASFSSMQTNVKSAALDNENGKD